MRTLSFLCLFHAVLVWADPPAVVPVPPTKPGEWSEVKAALGRLLVLSAEPASKWVLIDDESADLRVFDGGKSAAFVAPAAGRFKVIVTGPEGNSTRGVVVVGDGPPGPKPPKPPEPPADELKARLKAAYDADTGADKRESKKLLVELYQQIVEKVLYQKVKGKIVPNPTIVTAKDLIERAQVVSESLIEADKLLGIRGVVAKELGMMFPTDGTLTDEQRKAAAALFSRFAVILSEF